MDTPSTVDEYLSALPQDQRSALQHLREQILRSVPEATESISYGVCAVKSGGAVVSFGATKNHCSLYVQSPGLVRRLTTELDPYKVSGATIHFQPDDPLPDEIVELLVRGRLQENQERAEARRRPSG